MEKNPERLKILEKIEEYERDGKFDIDVENDPPSRQIMPGEVDYERKKLSSKIKAKISFRAAHKFINKLIKNNQFIIKEYKGLENFQNLNSGAIITCNHFNAFDSFAIQFTYEASKQKKRKFFRIIREGNYTSFPGFFGELMRNCNTLPLSSNRKTAGEFLQAVNNLLQAGHFILIYPEQSMWWNYKKPKPLKKSAFDFASRNNVPVLPCFITMEDSEYIDDNGFPVQKYTVNISEPIYPDKDKTPRENALNMMNKNYELWKEIYESFYGIKLEYTTNNK